MYLKKIKLFDVLYSVKILKFIVYLAISRKITAKLLIISSYNIKKRLPVSCLDLLIYTDSHHHSAPLKLEMKNLRSFFKGAAYKKFFLCHLGIKLGYNNKLKPRFWFQYLRERKIQRHMAWRIEDRSREATVENIHVILPSFWFAIGKPHWFPVGKWTANGKKYPL